MQFYQHDPIGENMEYTNKKNLKPETQGASLLDNFKEVIKLTSHHIRLCRELSKLIEKEKPTHINQLYWYDMKLVEALSPIGILKIILFNLFKQEKDEIANNYNFKNLYYGNPIGNGLDASGATVWNCQDLDSKPIVENDEICQLLESNARLITQEFEANINEIGIHPDNASLTKKGEWSGIFLYEAGGKRNPTLTGKFESTFQFIESLPISKNFGFVLFSRLTPGSKIMPHCGSSNLRFRYHLGVQIPEPKKAKLRVGRQWQKWQQDKSFGFDDSYEHEVVHSGEKDRVVMVVDVWNPALTDNDIRVLESKVFQEFGKMSM